VQIWGQAFGLEEERRTMMECRYYWIAAAVVYVLVGVITFADFLFKRVSANGEEQ
jgi:hypothetical protein